jgi:hypothetical protein
MGKSHKKWASHASNGKMKRRNGPVEWTPKMTMNMSDLSRDDDFLNHLLVEKLGTGSIPLYVHKMDPMRPLPKTDPKDLMAIVQRVRSSYLLCITLTRIFIDAFSFVLVAFLQLIAAKGPAHKAIKQAVDELLKYPSLVLPFFSITHTRYIPFSGSMQFSLLSKSFLKSKSTLSPRVFWHFFSRRTFSLTILSPVMLRVTSSYTCLQGRLR